MPSLPNGKSILGLPPLQGVPNLTHQFLPQVLHEEGANHLTTNLIDDPHQVARGGLHLTQGILGTQRGRKVLGGADSPGLNGRGSFYLSVCIEHVFEMDVADDSQLRPLSFGDGEA